MFSAASYLQDKNTPYVELYPDELRKHVTACLVKKKGEEFAWSGFDNRP